MNIFVAFKTEMDLNNAQRTACARHAGAARFAYNWGIARKKEAYDNGQAVPSAIDLHRELNALKKTELAWMYEVSKCAPQEALRDLDKAFKGFFRGLKQSQKIGFPKFKKKSYLDSFRLTGTIKTQKNEIQLPRFGSIKLKAFFRTWNSAAYFEARRSFTSGPLMEFCRGCYKNASPNKVPRPTA